MTSFSRVGEIAEQVRGVSYSKSDIFEVDGPDLVPLLRANNVTENGISFHEMLYVKSHHVGERQRLCVGDILVTASSGSIAVVGRRHS
jgi:type I restriction enzyme S subunit